MVSKDNEKRFESFFCDHWDDVVRICLEGSEHVLAQWRKSIGDARRVAVVDVGWTGTGSDAIRYMVKNILGLDTQVYTFLAASGGVVPSAPLGSIMQGELEPYIFSRCHNRELYDEHFSSNRGTDCIYFELFTQAQHPSFFGIDPAGAYQFDLPEVENYRMIQEMHEGIEYFCDCFLRHFSRYPHLFAISGYDAYLPFRLVIRSPFYIRKLFSSFTFARGLGADMENQRIETVGEIMDRLKL